MRLFILTSLLVFVAFFAAARLFPVPNGNPPGKVCPWTVSKNGSSQPPGVFSTPPELDGPLTKTLPPPGDFQSREVVLAWARQHLAAAPEEVMSTLFHDTPPEIVLSILPTLGPLLITLDARTMEKCLSQARTEAELCAAWKAVVEAKLVAASPGDALALARRGPPLSNVMNAIVQAALRRGSENFVALLKAGLSSRDLMAGSPESNPQPFWSKLVVRELF